jgi:hypothetical protein
VVPVERIELPTFGLQNRCSTAELNRLALFDDPIDAGCNKRFPEFGAFVPRYGCRARRQIPELAGKGYRHKTRRCRIFDAGTRALGRHGQRAGAPR